MTLFTRELPAEAPLATLDQRVGGRRNHFELYPDRVLAQVSDLLGCRELSLPLDTLSPHVVIRQRGPLALLAASVVLAALLLWVPGAGRTAAGLAVGAGALLWWTGRRQYIVFPGQIGDLELFRDAPDASLARRFVSDVVRRIESLGQELRTLERAREGERSFDRVGELIAFRELYAEGIIDRADLRTAAEMLARRRSGRIGFRP